MSTVSSKIYSALAGPGERSTSDKSDEYRRRGALCLRLAAVLSSEREKLAMVDMAQAWLELAGRVEKASEPHVWNAALRPPQFDGEEAQ
jgi:hypothetical protein